MELFGSEMLHVVKQIDEMVHWNRTGKPNKQHKIDRYKKEQLMPSRRLLKKQCLSKSGGV